MYPLVTSQGLVYKNVKFKVQTKRNTKEGENITQL